MELRGKTACLTAGQVALRAGTGPTGRPVCGRTCRGLGQQRSRASSSINGTSWKWAWFDNKTILFQICIYTDFIWSVITGNILHHGARIPLQMVWSQVCCVVQGYVVCRECTAPADLMRHQVEIHPEHKTTLSCNKKKQNTAFEETSDISFCTICTHFIISPLKNPQRRASIQSLQQVYRNSSEQTKTNQFLWVSVWSRIVPGGAVPKLFATQE